LFAFVEKLKRKLDDNQPPIARGGKEFSAELEKFAQMIEQRDIFDVAKNRIGNTYIPNDEVAERQRTLLKEALQFKADGYHVGIVCPCCEKDADFFRMKELSGQGEEHLTWANVFVNSNFPIFQSRINPLFSGRKVIFIGNTLANHNGLPFYVRKKFNIGDNAWVNDYEHLLSEMNDYIESEKLSDAVFIFCAGVLSNLLIYKLYDRFPSNTYLDLKTKFNLKLKKYLWPLLVAHRLVWRPTSYLHLTGWVESHKRGYPCDRTGMEVPWMNYSVVAFLKERLNQKMSVFEYGCGYSTLFYSRLVKKYGCRRRLLSGNK